MMSQATNQLAKAEVEAEEEARGNGINLGFHVDSVQDFIDQSAAITLVLVKEHQIGRKLLTTVSSTIKS
jgi:hypothetical protein